MSDSKIDLNWVKIFNSYNIIENIKNKCYFIINSNQINEYHQARLMTKFDYKSHLPKIFQENELSILPISRGDYIISNFKAYHDFDQNDVDITRIKFPNYIESINHNNITSESIALNCAYISGMIEDFLDDDYVKLTVNGRMSSLNFEFKIINVMNNKLQDIYVSNSQLEIDGGYEGINSLSLIEAKNSISSDFLIRQIYYPYRLWRNKITKTIRPIFLTYTNGTFHFREYFFQELNNYNSLVLLNQKKYIIDEGEINLEIIQRILNEINIVVEPNIPFPQADSFDRLINLCELLNQKHKLSQGDITENYDFDKRQTSYYTSAGMYLGLIDKTKEDNKVIYFLTQKGLDLFKISIFNRQIVFIKLILSHSIFNKTLKLYFKSFRPPNKTEILVLMRESNLYKIDSDSTFKRRASTISGWVNWILRSIET
ncbi:MAG: transcriptional regulator [Candidatus Sericytochromatia bacterium]